MPNGGVQPVQARGAEEPRGVERPQGELGGMRVEVGAGAAPRAAAAKSSTWMSIVHWWKGLWGSECKVSAPRDTASMDGAAKNCLYHLSRWSPDSDTLVDSALQMVQKSGTEGKHIPEAVGQAMDTELAGLTDLQLWRLYKNLQSSAGNRVKHLEQAYHHNQDDLRQVGQIFVELESKVCSLLRDHGYTDVQAQGPPAGPLDGEEPFVRRAAEKASNNTAEMIKETFTDMAGSLVRFASGGYHPEAVEALKRSQERAAALCKHTGWNDPVYQRDCCTELVASMSVEQRMQVLLGAQSVAGEGHPGGFPGVLCKVCRDELNKAVPTMSVAELFSVFRELEGTYRSRIDGWAKDLARDCVDQLRELVKQGKVSVDDSQFLAGELGESNRIFEDMQMQQDARKADSGRYAPAKTFAQELQPRLERLLGGLHRYQEDVQARTLGTAEGRPWSQSTVYAVMDNLSNPPATALHRRKPETKYPAVCEQFYLDATRPEKSTFWVTTQQGERYRLIDPQAWRQNEAGHTATAAGALNELRKGLGLEGAENDHKMFRLSQYANQGIGGFLTAHFMTHPEENPFQLPEDRKFLGLMDFGTFHFHANQEGDIVLDVDMYSKLDKVTPMKPNGEREAQIPLDGQNSFADIQARFVFKYDEQAEDYRVEVSNAQYSYRFVEAREAEKA